MPRPTTLPRWASVPNIDPTSGQANVIEPTTGKKDTGWNFKDRPSRNEDNWFKNTTFNWVTWFDDNLGNGVFKQIESNAVLYQGFDPDPSAVNLTFVEIGDIVHCFIPPFTGTSDTTALSISYVGSALPSGISSVQQKIIEVQDNSVDQIEQVQINSDPGVPWLIFQFNGSTSGFTASGTKGITEGFVISYLKL